MASRRSEKRKSLAVSIGASTAIFAVMLSPLPFTAPDRLLTIAAQPNRVVSIPTIKNYKSRLRSLTNIAALERVGTDTTFNKQRQAHRIVKVTQDFPTPWCLAGDRSIVRHHR